MQTAPTCLLVAGVTLMGLCVSSERPLEELRLKVPELSFSRDPDLTMGGFVPMGGFPLAGSCGRGPEAARSASSCSSSASAASTSSFVNPSPPLELLCTHRSGIFKGLPVSKCSGLLLGESVVVLVGGLD